jgi:hypothetical protein
MFLSLLTRLTLKKQEKVELFLITVNFLNTCEQQRNKEETLICLNSPKSYTDFYLDFKGF